MITFVTALYCEALPIIRLFELKKDTAITHFEVFKNTDITLIITKHSGVSAAVALTLISAAGNICDSDILINIGVCGCSDKKVKKGTPYLIHKIVDHATGYSYYPDIIYKHPFNEGSLTTFSAVQMAPSISTDYNSAPVLADMEASFIYQAGIYFYQPHHMFFIKIVSDYMEENLISPEEITSLITDSLLSIKEWLWQIKNSVNTSDYSFTLEEDDCYHSIASQLQLTATMANDLKQILHFYKVKYSSFIPVVNEFRTDITFPVKVKSEGKKYFEQLKKKLI